MRRTIDKRLLDDCDHIRAWLVLQGLEWQFSTSLNFLFVIGLEGVCFGTEEQIFCDTNDYWDWFHRIREQFKWHSFGTIPPELFSFAQDKCDWIVTLRYRAKNKTIFSQLSLFICRKKSEELAIIGTLNLFNKIFVISVSFWWLKRFRVKL